MNRGLTKDEAERGVIPAKLTKSEWAAMHDTSRKLMLDALNRTVKQVLHGDDDA